MDNFDSYEYLLIDKCEDFHYFKNLKDIAKYLDKSPCEIYGIAKWSRDNLNIRQYKSGLFIQRLYNLQNLNFPADTTFIWDWKTRMNYNKLKNKKNYDLENCFYPKK